MWWNLRPYILLVGAENNIGSIENNSVLPQKLRELPYDSPHPILLLCIYPKNWKQIFKQIHKNVHSSTFYNSEKLETIHCPSLNTIIEKMWNSNRREYYLVKKRMEYTGYSLYQNIARESSKAQKVTSYMSPFYGISRIGKSVEIRDLVIARFWRVVRKGMIT